MTTGASPASHAVRTAVATGENLTAPQQFAPLVLEGSADILQMAVGNVGITGALRIAEMADTFGMPFALVNCQGRYAAHVAAVMPNHLMMEVLDVGRDAVFTTDHTLEGGEIVLGEAPGIGLVFDEERLRTHAVERPSPGTPGSGYRRSPDSGLAESGAPDSARWAERPTEPEPTLTLAVSGAARQAVPRGVVGNERAVVMSATGRDGAGQDASSSALAPSTSLGSISSSSRSSRAIEPSAR